MSLTLAARLYLAVTNPLVFFDLLFVIRYWLFVISSLFYYSRRCHLSLDAFAPRGGGVDEITVGRTIGHADDYLRLKLQFTRPDLESGFGCLKHTIFARIGRTSDIAGLTSNTIWISCSKTSDRSVPFSPFLQRHK